MKRNLIFFLIVFIIYIISTLSIGSYVNGDQHKLLLMEIYNYWILVGAIIIISLFITIMLLWQRGDRNLDSLLKKSIIIPVMCLVTLYLFSFNFPDSYNLEVNYMNKSVPIFDYNNLQSGTSIHSERYQPHELMLPLIFYAMVALLSLSVMRYVFTKFRDRFI